MKSPKGFRGKYFSLAAILALNATLTLASNVQSVVDTQEQLQRKSENATSEEETLASELSAPVMVVSKKIKVSEVGAPFASEIYTKKEIQQSHSKDIYEFLNTQTSISALPNMGNPFAQAIDMRGYGLGYGYENTVVTINGRRMNNVDMSPQLLSSIPIDSIEKIEIIKGSGSVEYGDGANAGSINIITKDYDGIVIKSYMGDNGLKFASIGLGIKEEKFSIAGYIDDYSHDGFKEIANDGTKDESWNRNKSIKATVTPIEELTFNLGKTYTKMNVNFANAITLSEYEQNRYTIPSSGYNEYYYSSDVLSYGFHYKMNDKFSIDAQVSNEDKVSNYVTYSSRSDYSYKSYDTKVNYNDGNLKALIGIQAFDGERDAFGNQTTKENLGIYAKADYLLNAHTFSLGTRDENVKYSYESTNNSTEDKSKLQAYDIGYNYKLSPKMSFFTNYNRSFQAPDIDRFFSWGGSFNGFIEPMKVDTFNVGLNYIDYPHTFKITLFYALVDNEIYYNVTSGNNTNLKETEKRGIELSEKYHILTNLFTTLNYSYVDTEIIHDGLSGMFNGRDIPGVSPHNVKIGLGYNPVKPVALVLSHTYKSKTYAIDDFDGNYGKMESYHVTDLSATYTYKNYEVFAKVNNLFDEKNALFADGGAWSGLGVYPVNYERTFIVGFSAKF